MIKPKPWDKEIVEAASHKLAALLGQDLKQFITGTAAYLVGRLRNMYLMVLMIKLSKETGMSTAYSKVIRNHMNLIGAEQKFKAVKVITDVDPL